MARSFKSSGTAGEQAAQWWFKTHAWAMDRLQPPTKIKRIHGVPVMVPEHSIGPSDYVGYRLEMFLGNAIAQYVACEVKESHGYTMPASRLTKTQREWMSSRPAGCAFVGILWVDGATLFEVHPFKTSGSYRRGEGEK